MPTIEINHQNFQSEVLQSELPVLVDFWAPWCQPCLLMSPGLEAIAEEMEGKIKIAKLNTEKEENSQLAQEYQIRSIPNMKLFSQGKVVQEFIGLQPKEILKEKLEKAIRELSS
jgi:thioredoxin 1